MIPICTAQEMRAWDTRAIEGLGIPSLALMESAGRAVARAVLRELGGEATGLRIVVLAGTGNNGGDGLVVARWLHDAGADVGVVALGARDRMSSEAGVHREVVERLGIPVLELLDDAGPSPELRQAIAGADAIVDALFGTGLARPLAGRWAEICGIASEADALRIAVDMPSGVCATTGAVLGTAFTAHRTLTFGAPKWGHLLPPGRDLSGVVEVVDIGLTAAALEAAAPRAWIPEPTDVLAALPRRPPDAHKGSFGHLLLLAGSEGKSGAALLAGLGALRSGAGLVRVGAGPRTRRQVHLGAAEIMSAPARASDEGDAPLDLDALGPALAQATCLAIGPGLGLGPKLGASLRALLGETTLPLLLDADTLRLLAETPEVIRERRGTAVLTPHPGEMAALLGTTAAKVQADRPAAVRAAAERFAAVVLLKGRGTLVADPAGRIAFNPTGSPALATAGSGDVLAGCIGASLAGGSAAWEAAWAGAYLHGLAGELAAEDRGEAAVIASDLLDRLGPARRRLVLDLAGEDES